MRHSYLAVAFLLCMWVLTGCVRPPAGEPDLRGQITSVGRAVGSSTVQVLVEARPGMHDGSDKAYVFVLEDKVVLRRHNTSYQKARTSDLEEGLTVEVWFDGPVAESYPVQGTARTVVIVAP